MTNIILTETLQPPAPDIREILRYAGVKVPGPETQALLQECLREAEGRPVCRVCFGEFPVTQAGGKTNLGFAATESKDLYKNLGGCRSAIVFAATVGVEMDRLIARYARLSPARALMLGAIGTERVESLCDTFQAKIRRERGPTAPRFSPGYGDLPLSFQQDIFRVLDCSRRIGLTLSESLLMSPSKSVTAIIGLGCEQKQPAGCRSCGKTDCTYRREV